MWLWCNVKLRHIQQKKSKGRENWKSEAWIEVRTFPGFHYFFLCSNNECMCEGGRLGVVWVCVCLGGCQYVCRYVCVSWFAMFPIMHKYRSISITHRFEKLYTFETSASLWHTVFLPDLSISKNSRSCLTACPEFFTNICECDTRKKKIRFWNN